MAIISLQDVSLAFGGPVLFDRLNLQLEAGERVALLGRNGVGKTTLMKVMSGELKPDSGLVVYPKGVRVALLPQEVPSDITGNLFDLVLSGLGGRAKLLSDYHHVNHRLQTEYSEQLMKELGRLQSEMDHSNAWETSRQVESVIEHIKLDPESRFEDLSGGQKKRALLARALVYKPDILMLDEPTNHLDIESIDWLEGFIKGYPGTVIFVTHDRMFMQRLATKIIELDRGLLYSGACDYQTFLERKQLALDAEASERAQFEKKLAQEEIWIRQGIKARRTRNEGRVVALERMREQKKAQRQAMGMVTMKAQEAERSGQLVIKAENLTHGYGDKTLIRNFSTEIMRGDKIGVIGPNGSGKTTLLRILLDELKPQRGTVRLGTNIEIAYYDQLREQLNEEKTVAENVCESGDTVTINGRPRHILGYLQDFLFSPDRARTPVKVLSGGERNRLIMARLFTKPSNLLVLDEPTNDLDIETLELLEELLIDYSGTVLLVSHDRTFLNNVVTSTIVLEGNGLLSEYPGGYEDWVTLSRNKRDAREKDRPVPARAKKEKAGGLSATEKRELEKLPEKIQKLESEQEKLYAALSDPSAYQKGQGFIAQIQEQADALARNIQELYARWESLESRK
ncbi:MAG: ATP-binding cassette domain-containing protein [Candidatus Omnitrophica bacterium]|nr:ATP-binding cassette domain-containing protein [Candidatus Omnitrophota bacterium]